MSKSPTPNPWPVFEGSLRAILQQEGETPDVIDHIIATMRPIFESANQPARKARNKADAVQAEAERAFRYLGVLLQEIVSREVVLYKAGLR